MAVPAFVAFRRGNLCRFVHMYAPFSKEPSAYFQTSSVVAVAKCGRGLLSRLHVLVPPSLGLVCRCHTSKQQQVVNNQAQSAHKRLSWLLPQRSRHTSALLPTPSSWQHIPAALFEAHFSESDLAAKIMFITVKMSSSHASWLTRHCFLNMDVASNFSLPLGQWR